MVAKKHLLSLSNAYSKWLIALYLTGILGVNISIVRAEPPQIPICVQISGSSNFERSLEAKTQAFVRQHPNLRLSSWNDENCVVIRLLADDGSRNGVSVYAVSPSIGFARKGSPTVLHLDETIIRSFGTSFMTASSAERLVDTWIRERFDLHLLHFLISVMNHWGSPTWGSFEKAARQANDYVEKMIQNGEIKRSGNLPSFDHLAPKQDDGDKNKEESVKRAPIVGG